MNDKPRFTKLNHVAQFLVLLMILNALLNINSGLSETGEDVILDVLAILFSAVVLVALRQERSSG